MKRGAILGRDSNLKIPGVDRQGRSNTTPGTSTSRAITGSGEVGSFPEALKEGLNNTKSNTKRMRPEYEEYLKSDHWKLLRLEAVKAHGDRCSNCSVPGIDMHHLRYGDLYDVTTDDLMPLCRRCHENVHKSQKLKLLLVSEESSDNKRRSVLAYLAGFDENRTIAVKYQSRGAIEKERQKIIKSLKKQHRAKIRASRNKSSAGAAPTNQSPGDCVILTKKLINTCKTTRGGFTAETIRGLGLTYPVKRGWSKKLIGTKINLAAYQRALDGRFSKENFFIRQTDSWNKRHSMGMALSQEVRELRAEVKGLLDATAPPKPSEAPVVA